jgi:hypothetical protein
MAKSRITIDGDEAVLEGGAEEEWLRSDAVASLDDWT